MAHINNEAKLLQPAFRLDFMDNLRPDPQHADFRNKASRLFSSLLHPCLTYIIGMIVFVFAIVQGMEYASFVIDPIQMVFSGETWSCVHVVGWVWWGMVGVFLVGVAMFACASLRQ